MISPTPPLKLPQRRPTPTPTRPLKRLHPLQSPILAPISASHRRDLPIPTPRQARHKTNSPGNAAQQIERIRGIQTRFPEPQPGLGMVLVLCRREGVPEYGREDDALDAQQCIGQAVEQIAVTEDGTGLQDVLIDEDVEDPLNKPGSRQ